MATIFKLQKISFLTKDPALTDPNCRIEFNSNETDSNLDIAVYMLSPDFFKDPNNGISILLNDSQQSQPLSRIVSNSNDNAIFQISIPLDSFNLKDNIINFRTSGVPSTGSTTVSAAVVTSSTSFATATGFIEEAFPLEVRMQRTSFDPTSDVNFWNAILKTTIKFSDYKKFIDAVLCNTIAFTETSKPFNRQAAKHRSPFVQTEEYNLIKYATEYFMLFNMGIPKDQLGGYLTANGRLPYFDLVSQALEDDDLL